MTGPLTRAEAEELLYREAQFLDSGAWEAWIELYSEEAVFWVPAWRDETTPTTDPDSELSLIFYRGRRNLEDRVWRIESRQSVASQPRPRTVHSVTNVLVDQAAGDEAAVSASFITHRYDARSEKTHAFFGRYEYRLERRDGAWRIAMKKILLANDTIPTVLDIYSI